MVDSLQRKICSIRHLLVFVSGIISLSFPENCRDIVVSAATAAAGEGRPNWCEQRVYVTRMGNDGGHRERGTVATRGKATGTDGAFTSEYDSYFFLLNQQAILLIG